MSVCLHPPEKCNPSEPWDFQFNEKGESESVTPDGRTQIRFKCECGAEVNYRMVLVGEGGSTIPDWWGDEATRTRVLAEVEERKRKSE